jgi:flagellar hook protein FlgE
MVSGLQKSVTALHGFEKQVSGPADNTANANAHGFKKQRVIFAEGYHRGVLSHIQRIHSSGIPVAALKCDKLVQTGNIEIDLSDELGERVVVQKGYLANLNCFEQRMNYLETCWIRSVDPFPTNANG